MLVHCRLCTVLIVEVVELTIFELNYISEAVKTLDRHFVQVLQHWVNDDDVFEVWTVFDEVDLVLGKLMVDYK